MNAGEIMTIEPIRVSGEATVSEALQAMSENDIRHLPVVHGKRLLGIVSDRDLMSASGWLTSHVLDEFEHEPARVREHLSAVPLTVRPEEPVAQVAALLVEWGVGCAPVVEDGKLCGIVTEMDVLRTLADACRYGYMSGDGNPPVGQLMTTDVRSIDRQTPLEEAHEILESADFRHLPVIEDGRLLGMVSDRDIRMSLGRGELNDTPAADIMRSDVQVARPEDRLTYGVGLMLQGKFSSVPVEESGLFRGILTTTNVLEHCARTLRTEPESGSAAVESR